MNLGSFLESNIKLEPFRIIMVSWAGGGVLGNGLYTTLYFDTAQTYARGISGSLIEGGIGCSNGFVIYGLNADDKNMEGCN
jgi:hypothetical protein